MLSNKYSKWYFSIIEKAKLSNREEGEMHHILPRSLGGSNHNTNLVRLTYKEHFICHLLLTKMTEGVERTKMSYALKFMTAKSSRQKRYVGSSRSFEMVKKLFAEARRNSIHTPEARAKTSQSMIGNQNKRGKQNSLETNQRISSTMLNSTKMTSKDGTRKYILNEDVSTKLQEGWTLGWKIAKRKPWKRKT